MTSKQMDEALEHLQDEILELCRIGGNVTASIQGMDVGYLTKTGAATCQGQMREHTDQAMSIIGRLRLMQISKS